MFQSGPKCGHEKGSVFIKKWSHRGIVVDFEQKMFRKVTHFLNIFVNFMKIMKNTIFGVFGVLPKRSFLSLKKSRFPGKMPVLMRINPLFPCFILKSVSKPYSQPPNPAKTSKISEKWLN